MKIFSAIMSVLRGALSFLGRVAATPFVALAALTGRRGAPPIDVPKPAPALPPAAPENEPDQTEIYARIARQIVDYASESVIADAPASVPADLPRRYREWLPGLSREACEILVEADFDIVEAHIRGPFPIPGVPEIAPLPALREWPALSPPFPIVYVNPGYAALAASPAPRPAC